MFMIIALDIIITMRFYINCSTVIFHPPQYLLSREKPLVKPMAPRSLFHCIESRFHLASFRSTIFQYFTFRCTKQNYQKYLLYRLSISIRSHFCEWPWRDWQPLYRIGCKFLIVCAGIRWLMRRLLVDDTLVLKTEGNTYATLLHHPFLCKGKPTQAQEVGITFKVIITLS